MKADQVAMQDILDFLQLDGGFADWQIDTTAKRAGFRDACVVETTDREERLV